MKKLLDILRFRKLFLFAGLLIAAFFAISLGMAVCIVPVITAVVIYWFQARWRGKEWDWKGGTAALIGGAVIEAFVCLGKCWGLYI